MSKTDASQHREIPDEGWFHVNDVRQLLDRRDRTKLLTQLHGTTVHFAAGAEGEVVPLTMRGADFVNADGSCKVKSAELERVCASANDALKSVCDSRQGRDEVVSGRLMIDGVGEIRLVTDTVATQAAATIKRGFGFPTESHTSVAVRDADINVLDPGALALPKTLDAFKAMCIEHLSVEQGLIVLDRMYRAHTLPMEEMGDCLAFLFPGERELHQLGGKGEEILSAVFWPMMRVHSGCRWMANNLLPVSHADLHYWLSRVRGELPPTPTNSQHFGALLNDAEWQHLTSSEWIMVITAARRMTTRIEKEQALLEEQAYLNRQGNRDMQWAPDTLDFIGWRSANVALQNGHTEDVRKYLNIAPGESVTRETISKAIWEQRKAANTFLEQHPRLTAKTDQEGGKAAVPRIGMRGSNALVETAARRPDLMQLFHEQGWVEPKTGEVHGAGVVVLNTLIMEAPVSFRSDDVRKCLGMLIGKRGGALEVTSEAARTFAALAHEQFGEIHNYLLERIEVESHRRDVGEQSPEMRFLGISWDILEQYFLEDALIDSERDDANGISQFYLFFSLVLRSGIRRVPDRVLHKILASKSTTEVPADFWKFGTALSAGNSFQRILNDGERVWDYSADEVEVQRVEKIVLDINVQEKDPFARQAIGKFLMRYRPEWAGMFADAAPQADEEGVIPHSPP